VHVQIKLSIQRSGGKWWNAFWLRPTLKRCRDAPDKLVSINGIMKWLQKTISDDTVGQKLKKTGQNTRNAAELLATGTGLHPRRQ